MKNFIKKYPKRIIISALVILLVAIVGTVNNYRTYRELNGDLDSYFILDGYGKRTVSKPTMELLQAIYTDDVIMVATEGVYYKKINLILPNMNDKGYKNATLTTDKECYKHDETVVATLNNRKSYYAEFVVNGYVLQGKYDAGVWYTLHTGQINQGENPEVLRLEKGEAYNVEIPLEYISEEHDEPIKLKDGNYRIGLLITHKANEYSKKTIDVWAVCEFKIR